jgi:hypothetical protein
MYEKCVIAGPIQCALYEKTPAAIKARVDKIFNSLLTHPISTVIGTGPQDYSLVDYTMVRKTVFSLLYEPFTLGGPATFELLAGIERGNGSLWYRDAQVTGIFLQCSCDETVPQSQGGFGDLGLLAIECGDRDPTNDTVSDLQAWYESNAKVSAFAGVWPWRVLCAWVPTFCT